ncbi:MAG: BtpA/SgcQ family protein [Gemmatimonadota bacterium]
MRQPVMPEWRRAKPIIGMVHLLPLPGAPRWQGSMQQVLDAATRDAATLADAGIDALIVENYGDTPFHPEQVPPATIAALSAAVLAVRAVVTVPIGINVLRNDAAAALAICAATGGSFIRVNVHTGALLTDQGWLSGAAHETLRLRAQLAVDAAIFADVFVKHAIAPVGVSIEDAARDSWERGHADALIVSGSGTGMPTALADVERVKAAVPDASVFVGSGLTAENARALLRHADGAIVGSSLKMDGRAQSPVSRERVRSLLDVVDKL